MLRLAKAGASRGFVSETAIRLTDINIYNRYAGNLYRQALFTTACWQRMAVADSWACRVPAHGLEADAGCAGLSTLTPVERGVPGMAASL